MLIKVLFATSIILSGLFLAIPEWLAPIMNYGEPFAISRVVGLLAVIFETWWVARKLLGK
ncbi:hypothetical protein A2833_03425 [Candidatus Azambacteria bacterium RIFCSPHIGHO2_01_FULL_44_55]|uniref:Uncharacterized protein n=1 Tax=Candidatus Azambacteria bacterium RIFCSPLOWO2_02_FULL_44_14 TaxID=1797306 RepID=A0A1F5CCC4_9BACT|nr:MAG: hypothetical protein A3A18_00730 [Candidatus Azambacteria bacterium RIFCSPLOWO2_01_FULL_44_84]OGD32868.1 MAG: hypothetical protein A3C78_00875 [Candidatus Azambacteria bacterium RIFCSPHIGHO2_02_FULL_45_18]OGD39774.1 MAG: hypothetical protein A2833_03425 [Candidatus Azambacteria bacterium RIFCSPHIGHO2_01_FULL_44_55]OGD40511.1 MAG: hypothetical protein A3I30_00905 [Candidatus Azambacteria bacterium RIFCSPLOWO2_02_FULL_44_14]OGD52249.1 MAG: hypothetical protein A2608_02735 [Candidatus Azam